jgi:penicillin-binding protein 1B
MRDAPESVDAPYFVDLAIDTLQQRFPENDFENHPFRVYTTLDMNLQRDAEAAVRIGIQETDKQWKRRAKNYGSSELPLAQAALVVLDAQSGEVKALVGGRSYSTTQLNRVLSKRQPGSSFKPFVYAAAFASALTTEGVALTPASTVEDVPTTFLFKGKSYQPADHFNEYAGPVTLRFALAHSLNVPAVKIAEMVGYDKVARTARLAGLNVDMRPTPSIALGSYEVTPLEMAGGLHGFRELWECSEDEFDP